MLKYEREKHGHILANWWVVKQLVCEKHGLNDKDINVLLYFYGTKRGHFQRKDFDVIKQSFPYFRYRFSSYLQKGLFCHYRRASIGRPAIFMLSNKGTNIVQTMYRQLFGELNIRTETKKVSMYGKPLPIHAHAVASGLVDSMNLANRQRRLSPE